MRIYDEIQACFSTTYGGKQLPAVSLEGRGGKISRLSDLFISINVCL